MAGAISKCGFMAVSSHRLAGDKYFEREVGRRARAYAPERAQSSTQGQNIESGTRKATWKTDPPSARSATAKHAFNALDDVNVRAFPSYGGTPPGNAGNVAAVLADSLMRQCDEIALSEYPMLGVPEASNTQKSASNITAPSTGILNA